MYSVKQLWLQPVAAFFGVFALAGVVLADDVSDYMQSSLEAYKAGEYTQAMDDLRYVESLIQKKQNQKSASLMPEALPGWKADKIQNSGAAMAMFGLGGGTQMERKYKNGKKRINVMIAGNSPMMSAMTMIIGNPAMMSEDGYAPFRFGRIKGVKREQDGNNEVTLMLAKQIMVSVKGERDASMDDVMAYVEVIDFDAIKKQLLNV